MKQEIFMAYTSGTQWKDTIAIVQQAIQITCPDTENNGARNLLSYRTIMSCPIVYKSHGQSQDQNETIYEMGIFGI